MNSLRERAQAAYDAKHDHLAAKAERERKRAIGQNTIRIQRQVARLLAEPGAKPKITFLDGDPTSADVEVGDDILLRARVLNYKVRMAMTQQGPQPQPYETRPWVMLQPLDQCETCGGENPRNLELHDLADLGLMIGGAQYEVECPACRSEEKAGASDAQLEAAQQASDPED